MELNSLKHVELLRKGLYAKQLQHYSNLCKIYDNILKSESKSTGYISTDNAEKVFAKYAPLLEAASQGDYSFLETHSLSQKDEEIFKSFAYHSAKLEQYKTADKLLKDVIDVDVKTEKPTLSSTNLNKFKDFMNEPLECETNEDYIPTYGENPNKNSRILRTNSASRLLDLAIGRPDSKYQYGHSPRWLGHLFFKTSKNALDLISSIAPSHLPAGFNISDKLTPASFGAEITGVKGYIQKFTKNFQKKGSKTENNLETSPNDLANYDPLTDIEKDYFEKQPVNFHEKVYNQVVKAKHGSLKKVLAGVTSIAIFAGVISVTAPSIAETRDFKEATKVAEVQMENFTTPMSVEELCNVTNDFINQDYANIADFKEDANATLDAIQQTCYTYLNQYDIPSVDELKTILTSLDDTTSSLIEKPVEIAYQAQYPDFSNFEADLYYTDLNTPYTNLNDRTTEEGVRVTATDPYGNQITTNIPNIGSPFASTNLFKRAISQERGYDKEFKSLFEALSNPNTINPKTEKTYTYSEIRDLCNEFFAKIMDDCEVVRTLTVPDVVIASDGTFKFVIPEQEPITKTLPPTVESAEYNDR